MTDIFSLASKMSDVTVGSSLPPVDKWNPDYCGEIDIFINREGLWFHEGTPIGRPQLVRLFSTVLKKENNEYFLVTPVEKMKIRVADVPFIAVSMDRSVNAQSQQVLSFTTNVGDTVIADDLHALKFRRGAAAEDELVPYVHVRRGLEARLSRPVYYELAEYVIGDPPVVESNDVRFPFAEGAEAA